MKDQPIADPSLTVSTNENIERSSSTLGGYSYASYTLSDLMNNDTCQDLIRQAEVLADCSRDTFWITGNSDDKDVKAEHCDLELLAKSIYEYHMKSLIEDDSDIATNLQSTGGAEFWVQVTPAGTDRAPVDLHYDKDEVLAEKFQLGSFPTISTVTYLTEDRSNAPTVIFPHTYHDEEDKPIESMLLSRAARGKHVVFDGRLLHGAPGHQLLKRQKDSDEKGIEEDSSLRVTFLVNIWSNRPLGVNILPDSIRSRISSSTTSSLQSSIKPLEFRPRSVKIAIPSKAFEEEDSIILPFVSQGATWIDDNHQVKDEDQEEVGFQTKDTEDNNNNDNDDEEEETVEEEEELVLRLPKFTITESEENESDIFLLSFNNENAARLVRGEIPNNSATAVADNFITYLHDNVPQFVASIVTKLQSQHGIDVSNFQADHVCYRTDSIEQYNELVEALQSSEDYSLLIESEIGGRMIATFRLATPIEITSLDRSLRAIDIVEIPSPKEGSFYMAGLEHVEFVIGDQVDTSPLNNDIHQAVLKTYMTKYPDVQWNTKALTKICNPDISIKLGEWSAKFHLMPLECVIRRTENEKNGTAR